MSRPWIVLVRSGRRSGQKLVIAEGAAARVGREAPCDLVVPEDRDLSDIHFALAAEGGRLRLEDQGSIHGVEVNGQRVTAAGPGQSPAIEIAHGDWVRAGATDFSIYHEGQTPPLDDVIDTPEKRAVLGTLRGTAGAPAGSRGNRVPRLFALLDAARDERILQIVRECAEEARSLYDGFAGDLMAEGAPYLVDVGRGALLEQLVLEGWGKSWGVYLSSTRPFVEVRRHLRRFLIVQDDETEERLYFRFYDPRVLRVVLPTCTKRQTGEIFGDVQDYWAEDEDGRLLRFSAGQKAVHVTEGVA